MNPIDTYRDAFLKFVADGMDHAEAMEQFDEKEFERLAWLEINSGEAVRDSSWNLDRRGNFYTNDERQMEALFDLLVKASFVRRNKEDWENQAVPLMLAGWTIEQPDGHKHNSMEFWRQPQTMSLYWRAPSKRPGKPGRKYLSTNQAFNAMMKAKKNPTKPTP